jgi:mannose-1-phosphate guanylyltransferase/mannose-1-phosphate guanylyltransferase/mannose-6-phosphate isomerase
MIPIILSGGSGARLWPVSRESYPKQFCDFFDHSFLEQTLERILDFGAPQVVTVESMRHVTMSALAKYKLPENALIFEPMGKNTSAAVALICHRLRLQGMQDHVVGVFPADHLVLNIERFKEAINKASLLASTNQLVVVGVEPRYPATGYGYIEVESELTNTSEYKNPVVSKVLAFHEKPDEKKAQSIWQSRRHFWNTGVYVFKVSEMIKLFEAHMPEHWRKISQILPDLSNAHHIYANLESISVDFGITEKAKNIAAVISEFGWSDVGSWDEVARIAEASQDVPFDSKARVYNTAGASSNFVFSRGEKAVGIVGLSQMLVVDTPDALLLAAKGESEKVRDLVRDMRQAGIAQVKEHRFDARPWGTYEILHEDPQFKLKKIMVSPGQKLSYQSHAKRAETWVVIEGVAQVVLNDVQYDLKAGDTICIPRGAKHRMINPSDRPLVFVEVQTGSYFGEDDITRFQDNYGRA